MFQKKQYIDLPSGILNEKGFHKVIKKTLDRMSASESVMVKFNVDKFRELNNRYGSEKSDALLYGISEIMASNEKVYVLGRVDMDRFILLAENSTNIISELDVMLNQIVESLEIQNYVGVVTFTFGAYVIQDKREDVESMVAKARIAHKAAEKDLFVNEKWYDQGLAQIVEQEKYYNEHLLSGIENGEFKVYLQSQVSLQYEGVFCAESLIRWALPNGRLVYPASFVPQFEKNGMIVHLDYYMLECICKYLRQLKNQNKEMFRIAINLSNETLLHQEFMKKFIEIVEKYDVPHEYIAIEIQEVCFAKGEPSTIDNIKQLRNAGFVIAMDAFASGYSSLRLLPELPIQIIKLDRMFLRAKDKDEKMRLIIESIISLVHKFGIQVICEGVEHQSDIDFLQEMECDCVQGYYIMTPVPQEEFQQSLDNARMELKRKIFVEK